MERATTSRGRGSRSSASANGPLRVVSRRVAALWERISGSLWFVPAVIVTALAALAVALIAAQDYVDRDALERFPRLFGAGAESSRSMLATIAGSVITVAGVSFSIVVVAVSQASSQYTPRILRNFMRDRPSQIALGVLSGVFVYCLIVIRTIRGDDELRFIPSVAVLVAFLLAIVAIGFLVYFIHHIAGQLEAGSILARVGAETTASVDKLFPEPVGEEPSEPIDVPPENAEWQPIPSRVTGYISSVESDALLETARELDTVIRMERGVGDFVVEGTPLASVLGRELDDTCKSTVPELFTIGPFRTIHQDAEFGIRQMVDIALRALSPSENDTTTAVNCVDWLGAVLVRLVDRRIEDRYRVDRQGRLRVIAIGPTFQSALELACEEIRRAASGNVTVLVRLLGVLETVAKQTSSGTRRGLLRDQAERIARSASATLGMPHDREPVMRAHERLMAELLDSSGTAESMRAGTAR